MARRRREGVPYMARVHLSQLKLSVRPHGYDYNEDLPDAPVEDVVEVRVDGRELTAAGAGLGMPAWDVLGLTHAWAARDEPHTEPFARCGCGTYGCGSTDVTISREPGLVRWRFTLEVPGIDEVAFDEDAYDAEIARSLADHSWERPSVTAGRLVRERLDHRGLADRGLTLLWAARNFKDAHCFEVCLALVEGEARYQLRVGFSDDFADPARTADRMMRLLRRPPTEWDAEWLPNTPIDSPPHLLAGSGRHWLI